MKYALQLGGLALLATATVWPTVALAAVKREGAWPEGEKKISLDVSGASKADAVRRIAAAAGWNVVVHAPPGDFIDIHVKDLPPVKVLELVLNDGNYVARRDGNVIDITRESENPNLREKLAQETMPKPGEIPAPPVPPSPPSVGEPLPPPPVFAPPSSGKHGSKHGHDGKSRDKMVSGEKLVVQKGEVIDDLVVVGGSAEVYGEVEGDISVMGGSATIYDGAHVHGDVSAIGGAVRIMDGACVDGEVGVVGGSVKRDPGAKIGGGQVGVGGGDDEEDNHGLPPGALKKSWAIDLDRTDPPRPWYKKLFSHASNAVEHTALLFVFGAVLLSLATRRMDMLRTEIAARPMRSFAVGVLATLATAVALVALCVTVIGIPIAIVAVLVGAFGIYAGACAVLATVGKALVAHKSENQHVHLAVGCVLFLLLSALPFVGYVAVAAVALIGFGALVATRLAGFAERKTNTSASLPADTPYRSSL